MKRSILSCVACALIFVMSLVAARADGEGGTDPRFRPQEWYLQKVSVFGLFDLPFDYVFLFVSVLSVLVLYRGLFGGPKKEKGSCTASHILMDNHEDAIRDKMIAFKKSIGSDKEAFAKYAAEYSTCPSKMNGGLLGTFPKGAMVPAFDKCCFDPSTPMQTTVGPGT